MCHSPPLHNQWLVGSKHTTSSSTSYLFKYLDSIAPPPQPFPPLPNLTFTAAMASSTFRDSINSLGWSRATEQPANTSAQTGFFSSIQNLNPFQDRGYLQLPTHEASPGAPLPAPSRREEEEGWFVRESTPV
ncbi:hypothetical protein NQ176_g8589 [Zarea fungicola]|uniref:Uncharacterized protein n=1 Tax=Zarea fungicola TaxID=93591 RepID=A0ACC1MS93_9HYPO|nr:hypothetical protein NQ176_g8589 [Lecanicillium fungicola]